MPWEWSVVPKNITHWPSQVLNPDLSTWGPVHWPMVLSISPDSESKGPCWPPTWSLFHVPGQSSFLSQCPYPLRAKWQAFTVPLYMQKIMKPAEQALFYESQILVFSQWKLKLPSLIFTVEEGWSKKEICTKGALAVCTTSPTRLKQPSKYDHNSLYIDVIIKRMHGEWLMYFSLFFTGEHLHAIPHSC